MPSILIAPDKFKNTLAATEVADEIASVIRETMPDATIRICPMADGGEGTAGILASHLSLQPASILGHDPMMNKAIIRYYESADTCAVDCAAIVGLQMLSGSRRLTPWEATSYPLGEFINEMLSKRDLPLLDINTYKEIFCFPVKQFHIRIGIDFEKESIEEISAEYMERYKNYEKDIKLHVDVPFILDAINAKGISQYILSAAGTDDLLRMLNRFHLTDKFKGIYGSDNICATGKSESAKD